jgi:hypothetical protein
MAMLPTCLYHASDQNIMSQLVQREEKRVREGVLHGVARGA